MKMLHVHGSHSRLRRLRSLLASWRRRRRSPSRRCVREARFSVKQVSSCFEVLGLAPANASYAVRPHPHQHELQVTLVRLKVKERLSAFVLASSSGQEPGDEESEYFFFWEGIPGWTFLARLRSVVIVHCYVDRVRERQQSAQAFHKDCAFSCFRFHGPLSRTRGALRWVCCTLDLISVAAELH